MFHAADGFGRCHVSQCRTVNDVPDSVNTFHVRAVVVVHFHATSFHFNVQFFQADVFHVRGDSHGRQYDFSFVYFDLAFLVFDVHFQQAFSAFHAFHGRFYHHVNAGFLEGATHLFGYFLVFKRQDGRHEFNQQYFGTHGIVEVCQFRTDCTGAYHDHGFRFVVKG